jgi:hypothetical protein
MNGLKPLDFSLRLEGRDKFHSPCSIIRKQGRKIVCSCRRLVSQITYLATAVIFADVVALQAGLFHVGFRSKNKHGSVSNST